MKTLGAELLKAAAVCFLLVAFVPAAQSRAGAAATPPPPKATVKPAAEALLPAGTLLYVSVEDLSRTQAALDQTALAAIRREADVSAYVDAIRASLHDFLGQGEPGGRILATVDDLRRTFTGQVALALVDLTDDGGPVPTFAVVAHVSDAAAAQRLFDLLKLLPAEELREQTIEGALVRGFTLPDETLAVACALDRGVFYLTLAPEGEVEGAPPALLQQMLQRAHQGGAMAAGTLGADPAYRKVRDRLGRQAESVVYVRTEALTRKFLEFAEAPPEVTALLEAAGLLQLSSCSWATCVDAPGIRSAFFAELAGPRRGLWTLLKTEPVTAETLRLAPRGSTLAAALRIDPSRLLGVVRETLQASGEDAVKELDGALAMVKQGMEIDLEQDVFNALGDELAVSALPGGTPWMMGLDRLVVSIRVKDPAAFGRAWPIALRLLQGQIAQAGAEEEELNLAWREWSYRGRQCRSITMNFLPFSPTLVLADDRLLITSTARGARAALDLLAAPQPGVLEDPEFAAALAHVGGKLGPGVCFADSRAQAEGLGAAMGFFAGAMHMAMMVSRQFSRGGWQCQWHMQALGQGLKQYAADNQDEFPKRLDDLPGRYLNQTDEIFFCAVKPEAGSRIYVSGLYSTDPGGYILLHEKPGLHRGGKVVALQVDGNALELSVDELEALLKRQQAEIEQQAGRQMKLIPQGTGPGRIVDAPPPPRSTFPYTLDPEELMQNDEKFQSLILALFDPVYLPDAASLKRHLLPALTVMTVEPDGLLVREYSPTGLRTASSGAVGLLLSVGAVALVEDYQRSRRYRAMRSSYPRGGPDFGIEDEENVAPEAPEATGDVPLEGDAGRGGGLEANQTAAASSLRRILSAQSTFHKGDYDGNLVYDYCADYSQLYYIQKNGEEIKLISKALADADDDGGGAGTPKNGYLFDDLTTDSAGNAYDNRYECGICAWPAEYGKTGTYTYVIDITGSVYGKDLGAGAALTDYPDIADWTLVN